MTEVVAALIWQGDTFMICQRPAHKARGLLWEFVGGKVEPGESKADALVRECREELAVYTLEGSSCGYLSNSIPITCSTPSYPIAPKFLLPCHSISTTKKRSLPAT